MANNEMWRNELVVHGLNGPPESAAAKALAELREVAAKVASERRVGSGRDELGAAAIAYGAHCDLADAMDLTLGSAWGELYLLADVYREHQEHRTAIYLLAGAALRYAKAAKRIRG